jgi:glycosyltransferase involved in cell wall biosynthesis
MKKKPLVIVTRPAYWAKCKSDKMNLVYAPISGDEPTLLRNKKLCGDSVGGVVTSKGVDNLIRLFKSGKPQVFLMWCHYMQDGSKNRLIHWSRVLEQLRGISPDTIFLYGNGNQQGVPDFNMEALRESIDGVLVNTRDKREYAMYKHWSLKYVDTLHTFGFDPDHHGPKRFKGQPKYDCFFGGSQTMYHKTQAARKFYPKNKMLEGKYPKSKERWDFLNMVNDNFKLIIRGKGKWAPIAVNPYLTGDAYPSAFGEAKIALGYYHWDLVRYYTKRTIYSGASGRLLITHYIPEMEKDFTNHKNIVWFKTHEEGIDLIRHYLKNDKKREEIARAQRQHFIKNHDWNARLREFEKIVEKILG